MFHSKIHTLFLAGPPVARTFLFWGREGRFANGCDVSPFLPHSARVGICAFTESAVASRRRIQFNPAAHDSLDTHDYRRMEAALQTAANDGGPLHAGGNVFVERQPASRFRRARLGYPGTAGRQVLPEPAPRVRLNTPFHKFTHVLWAARAAPGCPGKSSRWTSWFRSSRVNLQSQGLAMIEK